MRYEEGQGERDRIVCLRFSIVSLVPLKKRRRLVTVYTRGLLSLVRRGTPGRGSGPGSTSTLPSP